MTLRIRRRTDGVFEIKTPFNRAFVDDLKFKIPSWDRSWDADERTWLVFSERSALEVFVMIQLHYGERPQVVDEYAQNGNGKHPPSMPRAMSSSISWSTALASALPPELSERVFKALARVLHPDAGGSDELMRELNRGFGR